MVAMYEIVSGTENATDDSTGATNAPSPSAPTPEGQGGPSPTPVPTSDASSNVKMGWLFRALASAVLALASVAVL
jgi:hypothetical protein